MLHINVDIFSMYVDFTFNKKEFNDAVDAEYDMDADFVTIHMDQSIYILVNNKNESYCDSKFLQALSHECCHAAFCIMEQSGIPVDFDNQETLCYLQDFVFRKCYEYSAEKIKEEQKLCANQEKLNTPHHSQLGSSRQK